MMLKNGRVRPLLSALCRCASSTCAPRTVARATAQSSLHIREEIQHRPSSSLALPKNPIRRLLCTTTASSSTAIANHCCITSPVVVSQRWLSPAASTKPSSLPATLMTQKRGFLFGAEGKHHQHFGAQDKKHSENLLLGYSPQQLYDVVANVSDYKNFLPYCIDSRVLTRYGNGEMDAELVVGFKPFTERYTSRVILSEPHTITSEVRSGKMFKHLKSVWSFKPGPNPNTCFLTFSVEFQFSSSLHQRMANLFFTEVVLAMSAAFEKRCREVYGPGSCPAKKVLSTTT